MTGLPAAIGAALVLLGGLLAERWALRARWAPYFRVGFPLSPPPVPIPDMPPETGHTSSVAWERPDAEEALFWADPHQRSAPTGLRGVVFLVPMQAGRLHLDVRWAPPWTPLVAAGWLMGLGFARQEWVAVPAGAMLVLVLLAIYRHAALRAAAELRWSWVSGRGGEDEPED